MPRRFVRKQPLRPTPTPIRLPQTHVVGRRVIPPVGITPNYTGPPPSAHEVARANIPPVIDERQQAVREWRGSKPAVETSQPPVYTGTPLPQMDKGTIRNVENITGNYVVDPTTGQAITGSMYPTHWIHGKRQPQQYQNLYNAEANAGAFNPGYEPTYWQDPRNVSIAYHQMQGIDAEEKYPWMDKDFITQAYDYFKLANGSDDWANWKYLAPDDPALSYLQSGQVPPMDYNMKPEQYQTVLFYDMYQTPAEQRDPAMLEQLEPPYRYILDNEQYFKEYQAWADANTPDWLRLTGTLMTDPAWNGALSMGGMGLVLGGIPGALGGVAVGGLTGLASKIENPILSSAAGGGVVAGSLGLMGGPVAAAIAGGIGAGAGAIYGAVTGSSLADLILSKMMLPAQWTEQGIGTAYQVGGAIVNPKEFGTVYDLVGSIKNVEATLQASKLTYENISNPRGMSPWINVLPELDYLWAHVRGDTEEMNRIKFAAPGETFSLEHGPLPYAINATQAAVFTAARRAILAGVDPTQVQQYYSSILGLPGEIGNLAGMLILNPLYLSSRAESAAMREFGRATGNEAIVEGWSGRTGRGFFGGLKNYKSMVTEGLVGLNEMSVFEKRLAGLTERNIPNKFDPEYHTILKGDGNAIASKSLVGRWLETNSMYTPEARARSYITKAYEYFNNTASNYYSQGEDVAGMVKAWEAIGKSPASAVQDLGLKTLGSPMAYALQRVAAEIAPKFRTALDLFESKGVERDLLLKVSRITGEKPQVILDSLAGNKSDVVFNKLTEALRLSEDPIAQQLLAEIDAKAFTVDSLKPITDAFTGAEKTPWHPKGLAVEMGKTLVEAAGEWSAKAFGVAEPKAIYRLANTFKSMQSLLLLGLNPAYFVNNSVNNIISRIATGVFGFDITNQREKFFEDMGYVSPRYKTGIGAAGNEPEMAMKAQQAGAELNRPFGEITPPGGEKAVRVALNAGKGKLAEVSNVASKLNEKVGIFSRASQFVESKESQMAQYYGGKKAWGEAWESGRFVTRMTPEFQTQLAQIDPSLPSVVSAMIRSSKNPAQIMEKITNGMVGYNTEYTLGRAVTDLNRGLKEGQVALTPEIARDTLEPIREILDTELAKATTTGERRNAFRRVREQVDEIASKYSSEDIKTRASEVRTQVAASGWTEYLRIADEIWQKQQADIHRLRYEQDIIRERTEQIRAENPNDPDYKSIGLEWKGERSLRNKMLARSKKFYDTSIEAFGEGMKSDDPRVKSYTDEIRKTYDYLDEFYKYKDTQLDNFYSEKNTNKGKESYDKMWERINKKYDDIQVRTIDTNATAHKIFTDSVKTAYGADAEKIAQQLVDEIAKFHEESYRLSNENRQLVNTLPMNERQGEYQRFNQDTLPREIEHQNKVTELSQQLFKRITGIDSTPLPVETLVETPTPEQARMKVENVEDAGFMVQALDLIDHPGKSGVLIDTPDGMTRLSSGYPDWYSKYEFGRATYHGETGLKALKAALDYYTEHGGQPELNASGEPFAIFKKIEDCISREGSKELIRAAREDSVAVLAERGERLSQPTEVTPVEEVTPAPVTDPGIIGDVPPGITDNLARPQYLSELHGDFWKSSLEPLLNAIELRMGEDGPTKGFKIPEALMPEMNKYLRQVYSDMATAKAYTFNYADTMRDWALLNYSDRRGIDNTLQVVYPYQFWFTRTAMNWLMRAVDAPAWYTSYYALHQFMKSHDAQSGFPSRMANKISIPAPYLPDWTNNEVFVDPLNQAFPFENFISPLARWQQSKDDVTKSAEYLLLQWSNTGEVSEAVARNAAATKTGDVWQKAYDEAKRAKDAEEPSPLGFVEMFLSPALYITYPWYLLTGHTLGGQSDLPLLPATRTGNAIKAITADTPMAQAGKLLGTIMGAPENLFRKATNMTEMGAWGEYYIERKISEMVARGECNLKDAKLAMINNSGPVWQTAQERMLLESALKTPFALPAYAATHGGWKDPKEMASAILFGIFPAGLVSDGELETRQLKDEYDATRAAYNAGDTQAYTKFFENYPEYEARMALFDTPEDRLRQFMITEVWDSWKGLGKVEQEQMKMQLGDDFSNNFLADETRNYEAVTDETLAYWANTMGGQAPESVTPSEPTSTTAGLPPGMAERVDAFRSARNFQFPNWYALQQRYYGLPEGSQERKDFLVKFPQLKEYWTWNKAYKAQFPEIQQYADEYAPPEYDYSFRSEITQPLERQILAYFYSDKPLSTGAIAELNRIWRNSNIGGDYQSFIDVVLKSLYAPTIQ